MATMVFDKFICTKEYGKFVVGETYQLYSIIEKEDRYMMRKSYGNRQAIGGIDASELGNYFEKVTEEGIKGWTDWMPMAGLVENEVLFYRSNGRKVEVRLTEGNVRAGAYCNRCDEFNLWFGIQLAYERARIKLAKKHQNGLKEETLKLLEKTKEYETVITDGKNRIEKMVSSLEEKAKVE